MATFEAAKQGTRALGAWLGGALQSPLALALGLRRAPARISPRPNAASAKHCIAHMRIWATGGGRYSYCHTRARAPYQCAGRKHMGTRTRNALCGMRISKGILFISNISR